MEYRLTKTGELCLGLFCTAVPNTGFKGATFATGRPVETSRQNGAVSVLLGHIIACKTTDQTATDRSMDFPQAWATDSSNPGKLGHDESGRTIAIHSMAILPEFQGKGLGRILMLAYMQQMNGAGIADRLALLAHDVSISDIQSYLLPPYRN